MDKFAILNSNGLAWEITGMLQRKPSVTDDPEKMVVSDGEDGKIHNMVQLSFECINRTHPLGSVCESSV